MKIIKCFLYENAIRKYVEMIHYIVDNFVTKTINIIFCITNDSTNETILSLQKKRLSINFQTNCNSNYTIWKIFWKQTTIEKKNIVKTFNEKFAFISLSSTISTSQSSIFETSMNSYYFYQFFQISFLSYQQTN